MSQATTLMYALRFAGQSYTFCGNYAAAHAQYWKALGAATRGEIFALTGKASDAVRAITSGTTSLRSIGASPRHLWHLAMAYAELGQPDDARRCIDDAIDKVERSKEKWCEAEVHRIAGEIALKSPAPDTEKAEKHFERALGVARAQQAKSWELRAAMSMARLWRDQGKRDAARDLLCSKLVRRSNSLYALYRGVVVRYPMRRGSLTASLGGVRRSAAIFLLIAWRGKKMTWHPTIHSEDKAVSMRTIVAASAIGTTIDTTF
jgi:tetratricopeptide (TPR) repeat protein